MAWERIRFDGVDSTNERAFARIRAGEGAHTDVLIATSQSAGRGTRGRSWASGPGGLYLSVILESASLPTAGLWTIAGSLAAHDVARAAGVEAWLDWPNDLVSAAKEKIAGVLAESRGVPASGPATYVLGIGLNVEQSGAELASGTDRAAASLRSLGSAATLADATEWMVEALERRVPEALEDAEGLFTSFFERCHQAGEPVTIEFARETVEGRFVGLDPLRGAHVELADGAVRQLPLAHLRSMSRA